MVQLANEDKLTFNLSPILKHRLIKVLNYQLLFKQEKVNTLTAIERTISSFQSALIQRNADLLKLPEILPLAEHQYE